MTTHDELTTYLDELLDHANWQDYPGAYNGLQVEPTKPITRVAAAVDASLHTLRLAVDAGAQLLLVHHGLFWQDRHPWVGINRQIVQLVADSGIGVYSSHLPLDAHPSLGNNAQLAQLLRLQARKPFGEFSGRAIGLIGQLDSATDTVVTELESALTARCVVAGAVRDHVGTLALCSGGAGELWQQAAECGADTLLTGEIRQHEAVAARDANVMLIAAGHYATETVGVRALAQHVADKFELENCWVDAPTSV